MTKQKIENKLCEYLNCTEVLWIKDNIDPQETTAKEAVELLVISNFMKVHGVDLSDKDFVMHSKGLFKFVKENKLLDNPICENFNFAKVFGQSGITMKISLSKIIVN